MSGPDFALGCPCCLRASAVQLPGTAPVFRCGYCRVTFELNEASVSYAVAQIVGKGQITVPSEAGHCTACGSALWQGKPVTLDGR
jgi:hypothetical protein